MDSVKNIFDESYNEFYLEWKNKKLSEDDILEMRDEARDLSRKYGDCDLVRYMTVDLAAILEQGGRDAEEK